jgi:AmiR/NasT family two-component response regulator
MTDEEPHHLRVLVADERQKYLEPVSAAVRDLGHEVIAHEVEIAKVGRATIEHGPDIAIVALHEDTDHALNLITEIIEEATCPVLALADDASRDFVAQAAERGVFAYLDSTNETELQGGIDVAIQRYQQYRKLLGAFDRRARIERAKGILMERHGIGDQEAFDRIRSEARSSRRPLIDVVEEVVSSGEESR